MGAHGGRVVADLHGLLTCHQRNVHVPMVQEMRLRSIWVDHRGPAVDGGSAQPPIGAAPHCSPCKAVSGLPDMVHEDAQLALSTTAACQRSATCISMQR